MRTAHYIISTHWDREWYEPLQGFRMRLVSMLDETFQTLDRDPAFKTFTMDGQTIPIFDYLEIRPEKKELIERYVKQGRLKLGPWYVLPDEWLVSGESIIRNIQLGMRLSSEFGAPSSKAGFACDLFGHISQLPQLFAQLGIPAALVWRGTYEKEHHGHFNWKSSDGTSLPTYRFGRVGYCSFAFDVRECHIKDKSFDPEAAVDRLVKFVLIEADRSGLGPILLFDGGDHIEIEPRISQVIARANEKLVADKREIRIVHSNLDAYQQELVADRKKIDKTIEGELRETGRDPGSQDEQWLIPGVYSSRIHLKHRNAQCEDELCFWAEPFSAFASALLEYPTGFLRTAWRHLLDNHPHDSICGCSPDQVHQDMIYRFDQSYGISTRLTSNALRAITFAASADLQRPEGAMVLGLFNHTAEQLDRPVDFEVPLPTNWPKKFQEFFGFEEKFAFKLRDARAQEVPYQLVSQHRDRAGFSRRRYKFPDADNRHVISITAHLKIPAFGYTTLIVEPHDGPTRYLGSMATSHRTIENEHLKVTGNSNGTIDLTVKKTNQTYSQLLTFEDCADIGDGWYHGVAVNDQIFTSAASNAQVALVADGINKATLRITLTMHVPESFDFKSMTRSAKLAPLKIVSDVTLRKGRDDLEITTTVHNTILDHRLRVLCPTNIDSDQTCSDSAFDVVQRKVQLAPDNAIRKELDVETKPHFTWTAITDGENGFALVTRSIPEIAASDLPDRPLALTLLRSFRRAVLSNDNIGGQIQGAHTFRYDLVPFPGDIPRKRLCTQGQRILSTMRQVDLTHADLTLPADIVQRPAQKLAAEYSFLKVDGDVVVSSIQREQDHLLVRLWNPTDAKVIATITAPAALTWARSVTLEGKEDTITSVKLASGAVSVTVPSKRIATLLLG